LNKAVADELQAVHQYMYFHFHLDDQGFKPLSQLFKRADAASKQLFERLVGDEEGHYGQYEKQHDNIKRFGLSYLALQSFGGTAPERASVPGE
jgi:bacterioferritin (cytochrome b1)